MVSNLTLKPSVSSLAGRGLLLHALGRDKEAADALREALLLPDRQFSHYIARTALAGLDEGTIPGARQAR
jgi:hypothetical protein